SSDSSVPLWGSLLLSDLLYWLIAPPWLSALPALPRLPALPAPPWLHASISATASRP
ncbi:hypothetical protein M9458_041372, partial [Cirrhinus mrigala]